MDSGHSKFYAPMFKFIIKALLKYLDGNMMCRDVVVCTGNAPRRLWYLLVVLFGEAADPLGGGVLLEAVCHCGWTKSLMVLEAVCHCGRVSLWVDEVTHGILSQQPKATNTAS